MLYRMHLNSSSKVSGAVRRLVWANLRGETSCPKCLLHFEIEVDTAAGIWGPGGGVYEPMSDDF